MGTEGPAIVLPWRKLLLVGSEPSQGRFLAFCALIGFFAGGAKALAHRKPDSTWRDLLAGCVSSALSSFIVGSAALYALGPEKVLLVLPIAGVGGWLGAALLDYLAGWAMTIVEKRTKGD